MEIQDGSGSSANNVNRGGRGAQGSSRGRGNSGNRGRGYGRGRGNSNNQQRSNQCSQGGNSNNSRPLCQVCFKKGHLATDCWHCFDENYVPDERLVAAATNTYTVDTNWYTDSGATDHVTSDLEKLSIREKYKGNDQINTASGSGMEISHIGHAIVPTHTRNLHLNNILHVPTAAKNLVSVHCLAKDN